MCNIDEIMYLISWNRSHSEQQSGITMAKEVKCINAFFRPVGIGYGKSVWENCARIICERSDNELTPYISDMLLWLQDLNWPGAEMIQGRLMEFQETQQLAMVIDDIVPKLDQLQEKSWLIFVSELLENKDLKKNINNNTLRILSDISERYLQ